jgi:REP element-mobilizing transposase RayT
MPRNARFTVSHRPTVYHVISRTALPGFPLQAREKDKLLEIIHYFSSIYFVEVLGFCLMGNHFHLAVKVQPADVPTRDEVQQRFQKRYGDDKHFGDLEYAKFLHKWTDLSEYVREIKQTFSRYFNKRHNRRGFFWGERFKSLIVEEGLTLVNLLAYIDLNPIRAGIVKRPEEYKWCSLGYHVQTRNKDDLLCTDFGMREWNEYDTQEIIRQYRQFVYETGAADRGQRSDVRGQGQKAMRGIDQKIVKKELKKKFKISRTDRFRYRTRYFTDAGIIGSKAFVGEIFDQFKHLLKSKDERKFKPVAGLEGVYSMKRLG